MSQIDIRWKQRLQNYTKALTTLENAVNLSNQRDLSDLEKQGLIQSFEYTHELAWTLMKDYFEYQGASELVTGSRDTTKEAFNKNLIQDGEVWMEMIKSRNQTSHTYNQNIADDIVKKIRLNYLNLFKLFHKTMTEFSLK